MKKTGRVLNFEKRKVYIVTEDNEFLVVKRGSKDPVKNEEYTGEVIKLSKTQKKIISFFLIIIMVFSIAVISIYLNPKATIVVDMNVTYKIKINKYDKIIGIDSLNSKKATEILKSTKVKGENLNTGLSSLFRTCISMGVIDSDYIESHGSITVFVLDDTGIFSKSKDIKLDLYSFESELSTKGLKLVMNNRGKHDLF